MALIELREVRRAYEVAGEKLEVLKGISLDIEHGEFVAIMGPSGSGKSTLMQILGLLDRPSAGSYKLMGRDVSRLSDDEGAALRSRTIGFVFQMFNLLARTSAKDNVMLPMIYAGLEDRHARAESLLKRVGLGDRLDHKPNQLSGGQQQRVAIARALANDPKIVFADEPTGNLASDQAEAVLRHLQELNESGITVILVTHEPDIAAFAKRQIRIKDGRIVEDTGEEARQRRAGGAAVAARKPAVREHPAAPASAELAENVRSALRAIVSNKLRSALSMLGILIGVAAVIAMLAIGRGAQKAVETQLSSLGSNLIQVWPFQMRASHGQAGARFTLDDLAALAKASPRIKATDGSVSKSATAVYREKNVNTRLEGVTAAYETMRNAKPYYGRFFTKTEEDRLERVALVGQTVAKNLFGEEDPVGRVIKLDRVAFRVIGVLPAKGSGGFRDQDDMVLIPLKTAMRRVSGSRHVEQLAVEADSAEAIPEVMQAIKTLMRRRHRLPDYKDDDFTVRNMADIQQAVQGTSKTFSLLLGIVAAISLLVGGIGIMNIMLVSVSERTREIGLRKAVGASRRTVLVQFLIESAVLSTCGGLAGILLGAGVSLALSRFAGWAAVVSPQSVLLAFAFSTSVGVLFGFWPARKASLLSPIEALRYE